MDTININKLIKQIPSFTYNNDEIIDIVIKIKENIITSRDNFPKPITHLYFDNYSFKYLEHFDFNQKQVRLSNSITNLLVPDGYFLKNTILPNSIISLSLPEQYNTLLSNLPTSIKYLSLNGEYNKSIDYLPDSIEEIHINQITCRDPSGKFADWSYPSIRNIKIHKLPKNLKKIVIVNTEFTTNGKYKLVHIINRYHTYINTHIIDYDLENAQQFEYRILEKYIINDEWVDSNIF
jgi:hypothetical protein